MLLRQLRIPGRLDRVDCRTRVVEALTEHIERRDVHQHRRRVELATHRAMAFDRLHPDLARLHELAHLEVRRRHAREPSRLELLVATEREELRLGLQDRELRGRLVAE
jgi:hypothetical protein